MKIKNLQDLFVTELRSIYNAEKQLLKALPKLARAASGPELRAVFEKHLEQTENQVTRLEAVFEELAHKTRGKSCEAMEGLIACGEELIDHTSDPATLDAGLIAAAQKVEHFEMASYGCLVAWAEQLGLPRAGSLLEQTLAEEKAADETLTFLAEIRINQEADEPQQRHEEEGHHEEPETEMSHASDLEHAELGV